MDGEPVEIIDKRGQRRAERELARADDSERARLAQLGIASIISGRENLQAREIVTTHPKYGHPPGELRYVHVNDWTDEQRAEAVKWEANERSKAWWAAQGQAQRETVPVAV